MIFKIKKIKHDYFIEYITLVEYIVGIYIFLRGVWLLNSFVFLEANLEIMSILPSITHLFGIYTFLLIIWL